MLARVLDKKDGMLYYTSMKKKNPLDGLLRLRGRFVLKQKAQVLSENRNKRNLTGLDNKRRALDEQE